MTFIKTSILSLISSIVKILSSLVINKAIALYIGPGGLAQIGQFHNFTQIAMTIARGGINTGVTKYAAEYGKNGRKIPILLSTASMISLASSVFVGFSIVIFSQYFSISLLNSDKYIYIFLIFGITICLFVINGLLLSILNGFKEIKTWISINIIQSIYSLIFTSLFIYFLGIDGALIALVTNQSVVLLIVLWKLRNHPIIKLENFCKKFDKLEAKKLMGFAAMAITSAIMVPASLLIVRNYLGKAFSWDEAGYWQAIWYISTMYLSIVTTALGTYYLPRLSEITRKEELLKEILSGYRIIFPIVVVISFSIYFLRDFIIVLLFTEKFSPMRDLFLWQLIGDILKTVGWLMGMLLAARAKIKLHMLTQVLFSILFVAMVMIMTNIYGFIGVSYAYAITYVFFIPYIYIIFKRIYSEELL